MRGHLFSTALVLYDRSERLRGFEQAEPKGNRPGAGRFTVRDRSAQRRVALRALVQRLDEDIRGSSAPAYREGKQENDLGIDDPCVSSHGIHRSSRARCGFSKT
jgi:hypothetical protein